MALYYDEESLNNKIKDISSKIPGAVKQSSYYIEDEELIIVKGTAGITIKDAEIKEEIINRIKDLNSKDEIITILVENVEPDEINLEKIRNEIYKEPRDAYVSKNPTTVHTHVNGVNFDITLEEAQKLISEDKKEFSIPLITMDLIFHALHLLVEIAFLLILKPLKQTFFSLQMNRMCRRQ